MKSCTLISSAIQRVGPTFPNNRKVPLLFFGLMVLTQTAFAQFTFGPASTIGNLSSFSVAAQGGYSTPTLVDLNGDGKLDIVTGSRDGIFFYYQNNGTAVSMPATPGIPSWTSAVSNPFAGFDVGVRSAPTFVDIDGDGDFDMFSGNSFGQFNFYKNVGTATVPAFTEMFFEDNPLYFEDPLNPGNYLPHNIGAISALGFLDADASPDGDLDLVASNSQGEFYYFENEGDEFTPYFPAKDPGAPRTASLRPSPQVLQTAGTNTTLNATVCVVDMNCDGLYDILSGTRAGSFQFRALEAIASAGYDHRFNTITPPPNPLAPLSGSDVSSSTADYSVPTAGDLDGDGDIDFISGRFNGAFVYFQNTTCNTKPTFTFGSGPGCGGTYTVALDATGNYTILPADIGNPSANDNGCFPGSAVVDYSLSSVDCDDLVGLIPVVINARNTVTGVKSATSCIVYVDVVDNIVPALPLLNIGTCHLTQPYYIDLDANGMATMGTVPASAVPHEFTDNCALSYAVLAQPPAAFQFNCTSITAPPFPTPPNNTPYQIVLQASDDSGNTATCIANVIIRDVTAPVVSPASLPNVPLSICTSQGGTATFTTPTFTVTDNCASTVTMSASILPIVGVTAVPGPVANGPLPQTYTFSAAGSYVITYTFTDNATPANVTTITQAITVTNSPLYFNPGCPPNISVAADPVTCQWISSWTPPVGFDCTTGTTTGVTTYGTRNSGDVFPITPGETVVYTAFKGANTIQCFFTVTVTDATAPSSVVWTPSSIADQAITTGQGACGATTTWTVPNFTAVENCSGPAQRKVLYEFRAPGNLIWTTTTSTGPGATFPVGETRVTYSVCDQAGNTSLTTLQFIITVTDGQFPSITCPNPITTVTSPGLCYADIFLPKPSGIYVSDNCPLPVGTVVGPIYGPPGGNFPPGSDFWRFEIGTTNPVNFSVTDASGNTSTCTMTVTVLDNQKPVFSNCVTADVPLVASPLMCTVAQTITHPTVTDNSLSCTFPGILTYTLTISGATTLAATPVVSGNTLLVTFNEGVSTVLYTATDGAGNSETCQYLVKVTNSVPPSFTNCPSFQGSIGNLPTDAGQCYYTLTATSFAAALGASGSGVGCDPGTFTFTRLPNIPLPLGSQLGLGTHVLKVVATDYSGSTASCQFSVTIQDLIVPTTTSAICNTTLNFNTALNTCAVVPTWNAPIFVDNCGIQSTTVTYTNPPSMTPVTYISGSSLSKGTYIFTYTARDAANNPGFCTFTVNINDAQKPAFTNCPTGTQYVNVGPPTACAGAYTLDLTATDNCAGAITIAQVITKTNTLKETTAVPISIPVDLDPLSLTPAAQTVTYMATDVSGNTTLCTITVQARDVSGPVIPPGQCPVNQSLTIGSPLVCTLPASWVDPSIAAMMDCTGPITAVSGPVAISQNLTPITVTGTAPNRSATFPTGVNTITYVYQDGASPANTSTCVFTVTVIEGVPPVFTACPPNITVSAEAGTCARTLTAAYLRTLDASRLVTATDLCSPTVTYSILPASTSVAVGSCLSVTWSAMDNSNNTNSSCVQSICVVDSEVPVPTCGAPYTITTLPNNNCVENNNSTYPTLINPAFTPALPTFTDNCAPGSVVISRVPGQPGQYCVGTHQLFWRITDGNGNSATCAQTITVLSNVACAPSLATLSVPTGVTNLSNLTGITCCTTPSFVSLRLMSGPVAAGPYPGPAVTNPAASTYNFTIAGTYTVEYTVACGVLKGGSYNESMAMLTFNRDVVVNACAGNYSIPNCVTTATTVQPIANQTTLPTPLFGFTGFDCNNAPATVIASPATLTRCATVAVTYTAGPAGPNQAICTRMVTVAGTPEVCNNGIDDDCDGFIDGADSDCTAAATLTITCPSDRTIVADPAPSCEADLSSFGTPIVGGTCLSFSTPVPDASTLPPGTHDVLWTVTGCNLTRECLQVVTVVTDTEIPGNGIDEDCDGFDGVASGCPWNAQIKEIVDAAAPGGAGAVQDNFGVSVDVAGDWAVVGAYWEDDGSLNNNRGSAYILQKVSATDWTIVRKLVPSGGMLQDLFGESVSIWVNPVGGEPTVVVGARWHDNGVAASQQGAAYVYRRDFGGAGNWGLVKKLVASDASSGDEFGTSVSIDGDIIAVGAPNEDFAPSSNNGAIYMFGRDNGGAENWGQFMQRRANDLASSDFFGASVSVSQTASTTYVIAGSRMSDPLGLESGSAYIFDRNFGGANNFGQQQKLTALGGASGDQYGVSVAIDGTTAVVGSYFDNDNGLQSGSAFVYDFNGTTWNLIIKLTASDGEPYDQFGNAIDIDGNNVVVGARYENTREGSLYLFNRNEGGSGNWGEVGKRDPSDGSSFDQFAYSVAISGCTIIAGAPKHNIGATNDQGAAYFFDCGCVNPQLRPMPSDVVNRDERKSEILDHTGGFSARCFPNPFSDLLNIELQLENEEEVRISVSDATGRVVASVYNGLAAPGQLFQWDTANNPTGLYFVRIEAGANRKVVPVSMVK